MWAKVSFERSWFHLGPYALQTPQNHPFWRFYLLIYFVFKFIMTDNHNNKENGEVKRNRHHEKIIRYYSYMCHGEMSHGRRSFDKKFGNRYRLRTPSLYIFYKPPQRWLYIKYDCIRILYTATGFRNISKQIKWCLCNEVISI